MLLHLAVKSGEAAELNSPTDAETSMSLLSLPYATEKYEPKGEVYVNEEVPLEHGYGYADAEDLKDPKDFRE